MLTHLVIQRLWKTARYRRLIREVLTGRPEAALPLQEQLGGPTAAAALALLRLIELNQADSPLARELLGRLLFSQGNEGAWGGDLRPQLRLMMTAMCLRTLIALEQAHPAPPPGLGMSGIALDAKSSLNRTILRGLMWVAGHQQEDGGWAGGAIVTGFVLLQLGRCEAFREMARVDRALAAGQLELGRRDCDPAARLIWAHLRARSGGVLETVARTQAASAERRRRAAEQFAFAEVA